MPPVSPHRRHPFIQKFPDPAVFSAPELCGFSCCHSHMTSSPTDPQVPDARAHTPPTLFPASVIPMESVLSVCVRVCPTFHPVHHLARGPFAHRLHHQRHRANFAATLGCASAARVKPAAPGEPLRVGHPSPPSAQPSADS